MIGFHALEMENKLLSPSLLPKTMCSPYSNIYISSDFEFDNPLNFNAELQKSIIEQTRTYATNIEELKQI